MRNRFPVFVLSSFESVIARQAWKHAALSDQTLARDQIELDLAHPEVARRADQEADDVGAGGQVEVCQADFDLADLLRHDAVVIDAPQRPHGITFDGEGSDGREEGVSGIPGDLYVISRAKEVVSAV